MSSTFDHAFHQAQAEVFKSVAPPVGGNGLPVESDVRKAGRWNPTDHPRDENGRFVELGGIVSLPGGGEGRVLGLGGGKVRVETADGKKKSFDGKDVKQVLDATQGENHKLAPTPDPKEQRENEKLKQLRDKFLADRNPAAGSVTLDDGKTQVGDLVELDDGSKGLITGISGDARGGYGYKVKVPGRGNIEADRETVKPYDPDNPTGDAPSGGNAPDAGGGGGTAPSADQQQNVDIAANSAQEMMRLGGQDIDTAVAQTVKALGPALDGQEDAIKKRLLELQQSGKKPPGAPGS